MANKNHVREVLHEPACAPTFSRDTFRNIQIDGTHPRLRNSFGDKQMKTITRIGRSRYSPTRGRIVVHGNVLTTVATANVKSPSVYEQARDALGVIDQNLVEAGTDKSSVTMVMVYVSNIKDKSEFNRAWDEWVDRENLPVRACLGVDLEGEDLVELVVTAAIDM